MRIYIFFSALGQPWTAVGRRRDHWTTELPPLLLGGKKGGGGGALSYILPTLRTVDCGLGGRLLDFSRAHPPFQLAKAADSLAGHGAPLTAEPSGGRANQRRPGTTRQLHGGIGRLVSSDSLCWTLAAGFPRDPSNVDPILSS